MNFGSLMRVRPFDMFDCFLSFARDELPGDNHVRTESL